MNRFLLFPVVLIVAILLAAALAACGTEGAPGADNEGERHGNGDRDSRVFFGRETPEPESREDDHDGDEDEEPEPTRRGLGAILRSPTATPETSSVGFTTPTPDARSVAPTVAPAPAAGVTSTPGPPLCQQREPDASAMLAPAQTSAETDKQALLALFEATGGESWDRTGTWAGRAPIGDWQGVGVDGGTPTDQAEAPLAQTVDEAEEVAAKWLSGELPWPNLVPRDVDRAHLVDALLAGEIPLPTLDASGEGRVTALQLSGLAGELPPELGNLTALEIAGYRAKPTGRGAATGAGQPDLIALFVHPG